MNARSSWLAVLAAGFAAGVVGGCLSAHHAAAPVQAQSPPRPALVEGVLFAVAYESTTDKLKGFTRLNNSKGVPGGNGTWNEDAYGKLYDGYLLVTFPQKPELGPLVIPQQRLVEVRFGDGGIKSVAPNANP